MRRLLAWTGGAAAIVAVAGAAFFYQQARVRLNRSEPERARAHQAPLPVRTSLVAEGPVEEIVGATAVTEPSATATIRVGDSLGLPINNVAVRAVHVAEGDRVERGQVLFELQRDVFDEAVAYRQVELGAAAKDFDATKRLFDVSVSTTREMDRAEHDFELAKFNLFLAEHDLARCDVKSPIAGIVDTVDPVAGEVVPLSGELTTVYQLDPIHVRMDFPQQRIPAVAVGQEAEVVLDCFPDETFTGKVIRIAGQVDPQTRVLPVIIEVANADYRIKGGVSGFVRLRIAREAKSVPATAVIQQRNQAMVFRVEEGRARIRPVRVGPLVETGQIEVLEGLSAGDEIIIFGNEELREGDLVNVDWRRWSGRD